MNIAATIIQIILGISVVTLIFLQSPGDSESRSNILSTTSFQKRGWEKVTFVTTIVVSFIFIFSSLIQAML